MNPLQPAIIRRSEHNISRKWISSNALRVLYRLKETGHHAYLVGGGVRDLLLGREPKDFDVATDARPGEVKRAFRNCRLIGRRFRLAHVHFHDEIIEVATFRSAVAEGPDAPDVAPELHPKEPTIDEAPLPEPMIPFEAQPAPPAAKPKPPRLLKTEDGMILRDNVFGTPEEDALRRDFTVNALFYNIADFSVIDYVGGMADLKSGLIRTIGDPAVRFIEDPVRMVRAVRFAAMLGFAVEENTYRAMVELKEKVALASPSRMYEEVMKLFLLGEGEKTYQMLRKTGLFGVIFPRLNGWVDTEHDGFPHTWIGKALEWVDASVQAGRRVGPHILFGLIYGQFVEERAAESMKASMPALEAVTKAVSEAMSEQSQRVMIPRKVGLAMRDIYWNQHRFEKREGKHPRYFLNRPGFSDSFEYFLFKGEATGANSELRAWWKEFIKANPPARGEAPHEAKGRTPSSHRRRRRRRGRGPDARKPKT